MYDFEKDKGTEGLIDNPSKRENAILFNLENLNKNIIENNKQVEEFNKSIKSYNKWLIGLTIVLLFISAINVIPMLFQ